MIMVTPKTNMAMKSIFKFVCLLALPLLATVGCERYNPEDEIITYFDMPRCMQPVRLSTDVEYNRVEVSIRVFHDAEYYIFETYNSVIYEDSDPYIEDRVDSMTVKPKDIPFVFTTLEDVTLYYRIQALNPSKGKEPSRWAVGKFTTKVDPALTCLTLSPEAVPVCEIVTFNWTPATAAERYLLELYSSAVPSSGEPDPANLIESIPLTVDQLPYSKKFGLGTYYYRVKAIDTLGVRKDSKWSKGDFKVTEVFEYPNDEGAYDYGVTPGTAKTGVLDVDYIYDNYEIDAGDDMPSAMTEDKITWLYSKGNTGVYMGDFITYARRAGYETLSDGNRVANDVGCRFKINKPGTLKFFCKLANKQTWAGNECRLQVALETKKNGAKKCEMIHDARPENIATKASEKSDAKYWVSVDILEDMLYGIEEPATIYIWHELDVTDTSKKPKWDYYPPTWIPAVL